MSTVWKRIVLMVAGAALMLLIAACGRATTTASCGFVVGSGQGSRDAKLHRIIYPGQQVEFYTGEVVSYVPCNSRNYIINDGTVKNANGEVVGDRNQLIVATTKSGVSISIAARALWTLNQSEAALRNFYNLCFKYTCADSQDKGGGANFSTKGWNGMLAENFGPAIDAAARAAAFTVDDSIWKQHDPAQYKALGDTMSAQFADAMRANLGYNEDLFCGSGNSQWSNPEEPGKGTFNCSPVRIVVDEVKVIKSEAGSSSEGVTALNEQRLKNAQALYGAEAGYWLGLQDSIALCKSSGTACVINIGGAGSPGVTAPAVSPSPSPR